MVNSLLRSRSQTTDETKSTKTLGPHFDKITRHTGAKHARSTDSNGRDEVRNSFVLWRGAAAAGGAGGDRFLATNRRRRHAGIRQLRAGRSPGPGRSPAPL
ncbi:hypothetical protein JYU34_007443 [Plutella xylostella]|uniref:Uncharacterized protein n=1 Tax=Plutella xylostella TaxID=51655 RepID=A0ABQ7QQF3_PLUXY|nr:hypothetical protein JYU34_007443 [Plutella xylostella]